MSSSISRSGRRTWAKREQCIDAIIIKHIEDVASDILGNGVLQIRCTKFSLFLLLIRHSDSWTMTFSRDRAYRRSR
jgi:hypothetical protein